MGNKKKRKLWFLCASASNNKLPEVNVEGLLISAGYDVKNAGLTQKTRQMIEQGKPKHLMIDCGYQLFRAEEDGIRISFDPALPLLATKKILNVTPRHVVEKAIEINADIMVALDFPVRKLEDAYEQEQEFRYKLHYNVPWAIETAKLRKKLCPGISLLIPVQAYDIRQFEKFYEKIKRINFDGFSLPTRNMSMMEIALFMRKFHSLGIKKVHILGSSSLPTILVSAFMAQKYFDWVSFDATTWRKQAQNGRYIHPYDLSCKDLNKIGKYDTSYRCHCPSCQGMTIKQVSAVERKERTRILRTHNFLAIQNFCKEFGEASFDVQYLENRLRKSKRRDLKNILNCMSEIESICSVNTNGYSKARSNKGNSLHAHA